MPRGASETGATCLLPLPAFLPANSASGCPALILAEQTKKTHEHLGFFSEKRRRVIGTGSALADFRECRIGSNHTCHGAQLQCFSLCKHPGQDQLACLWRDNGGAENARM